VSQPPSTPPLENRNAILKLFVANAISGFAQGLSMLSIPWYFTQIGAASEYTLYYGLITFAMLFWGMAAGGVIDRFRRKNVFLGLTVVEGLIVLLAAIYGLYQGGLDKGIIILVFGVTVAGFQLHYPNLYAFIQQIVLPEQLRKVTSWIEIVGQSTMLLSGTMGAFFLEGKQWTLTENFTLSIPKLEIHEIFLLDGITYLIAFILIITLKYKPYTTLSPEDRVNFLERLKKGIQFLRERPALYGFGVSTQAVFVMILVQSFALAPIYVSEHLGADGAVYGLQTFFKAAGAILSGNISRLIFRKIPLSLSIVFLMCAAVLLEFSLLFTQSEELYLLAAFIFGYANSGIRIFRVTYILERVPNQIIGRVNSVISISVLLLRVFFILLFALPFFATGEGVRWAIAILGIYMTLSVSILAYLRPSLRREHFNTQPLSQE